MNPIRRHSRQRDVILEELRKRTSHPTAAHLYAAVRRRLPRISLGTVYRNLEVLTQEKRIRRLQIAGGEARFDACLAPHHHVRCALCGRIDDVPEPSPGPRVSEELCGYEILEMRLEYLGICPECRRTDTPQY